MTGERNPVDDVVEACADALLTACAVALTLNGVKPAFGECLVKAWDTLQLVTQQTLAEGPRPQVPE